MLEKTSSWTHASQFKKIQESAEKFFLKILLEECFNGIALFLFFFFFFPAAFVFLLSPLQQSRFDTSNRNDACCLRPQPGCRVRALDERQDACRCSCFCCCGGADVLAKNQCPLSPPPSSSPLPGRRQSLIRGDRLDAAPGLRHRPLALEARLHAKYVPVGGAVGTGGEI